MDDQTQQAREFQAEAAKSRTSLPREFWDFLKHNKKWWLLPILVVTLLVGFMVLLSSTAAGPFIYTIF